MQFIVKVSGDTFVGATFCPSIALIIVLFPRLKSPITTSENGSWRLRLIMLSHFAMRSVHSSPSIEQISRSLIRRFSSCCTNSISFSALAFLFSIKCTPCQTSANLSIPASSSHRISIACLLVRCTLVLSRSGRQLYSTSQDANSSPENMRFSSRE